MNPRELKAKLDFLANLSDVANAVMEEIANSLNYLSDIYYTSANLTSISK